MMERFNPWGVSGPWLHVLPEAATMSALEAFPPSGVTVVARLDGAKMLDADGVFEQFWEALRFPDYFGWNWPALSDCLRDLQWLPASQYLVVVESSSLVLSGSEAERGTLFRVLQRAAEEWANPHEKPKNVGVPFNVLFVCAPDEVGALRDAVRHL
ncbi:barstar family protein [Streptomyces syringium]|uniref:barstar family protein n=1 Tax=Streptomyces syringium TaxID=76729 RepID=UPI00342E92E2